MKRILKKEGGYATFLSLVILVSLSAIVLSFLSISSTQLMSLKQFKNNIQVQYNADSGIEDLISKYYNDILYDENTSSDCINQNFGRISYQVCGSESPNTRVESQGDCNFDDEIDTYGVVSREINVVSTSSMDKLSSTVKATLKVQKNICDSQTSVEILAWSQEK